MAISRDGKEKAIAFCLDIARTAPIERMEMVRRGIAAAWLAGIAGALGITEGHLILYLGLDRRRVVTRRVTGERLDARDSDAVMAIVRLLGEALLRCPESGPQASRDRLAIAAQVGAWLRTPTPKLEYRAPIQYLDVAEGRTLVATLRAGRDDAVSLASDEKRRLGDGPY